MFVIFFPKRCPGGVLPDSRTSFGKKITDMKENMFLSFFLDGWSDRAERWVNARC